MRLGGNYLPDPDPSLIATGTLSLHSTQQLQELMTFVYRQTIAQI